MLSLKHVMFLSTILTAGILVSLVIAGTWLNAGDVAVANNLSVFTKLSFFGLINIPVPNVWMFVNGLNHLINFDFAFFQSGGTARWIFLMILGPATLWGVFTTIIVVATNLLPRR